MDHDPEIDIAAFARTYRRFMEAMAKASEEGADQLTPLGRTVTQSWGWTSTRWTRSPRSFCRTSPSTWTGRLVG
jgi:hypothetical protein